MAIPYFENGQRKDLPLRVVLGLRAIKTNCFSAFLLFFVCSGCSPSTLWKLDTIATGNGAFDSTRLTYFNPISSPLQFEMICMETGIESFLNLTKYKFLPGKNGIKAQLQINGEITEEMIPVLEGKMRVRLSNMLTQSLIEALKKGQEVSIFIDGFEQHLMPDPFLKLYFQSST